MIVIQSCRSRKKSGSALIEIACSAFLFTIFSILSVQMGAIIYGAYLNDIACRDAARAAAQGKTSAESLSLAKAVLKSYEVKNTLLTGPTIGTDFKYEDYSGAPPAQTSPYVLVTTSTVAGLPFMPFLQQGTPAGPLTFKQTYCFPIVRIR